MNASNNASNTYFQYFFLIDLDSFEFRSFLYTSKLVMSQVVFSFFAHEVSKQ